MGSPVSRLQQPRAEQPELYNFAADFLNLYPSPTLTPFGPVKTTTPPYPSSCSRLATMLPGLG